MNLDEKLARLDELFGSYKAEWLNEKIFHFFAAPSYFTSLKDKRPCVLMGGRGTGKTTVLRGLSYKGQYALKGVCQNVHILFFMHKAPTFSSQGFAIS